jgi:hypothetical protein
VKKLIVLLALAGIFSYLVLPGVVEDQLSKRLQVALGAPVRPDVEVSSSFPPEMLLGRIDRIQVRTSQISLQGVALYNARADLRDVHVSVPSLLRGQPIVETSSCTLNVETPLISIEQREECLGYLGLGSVW